MYAVQFIDDEGYLGYLITLQDMSDGVMFDGKQRKPSHIIISTGKVIQWLIYPGRYLARHVVEEKAIVFARVGPSDCSHRILAA
jgi:hypothetical protein